jgi:hypothetical protein
MNRAIRIKATHVSKATIDADSNSILQNFPMQTDMGANAALWNANVTIPRRAAVRTSLTGATRGQGYYGAAITFDVMTFGQVDYFRDTFLATSNESGLVTVKLYDQTDTAIYLQCTLVQPNFQNGQIAIGYTDVVWNLIYGINIT